jgi:hypothetical protein
MPMKTITITNPKTTCSVEIEVEAPQHINNPESAMRSGLLGDRVQKLFVLADLLAATGYQTRSAASRAIRLAGFEAYVGGHHVAVLDGSKCLAHAIDSAAPDWN